MVGQHAWYDDSFISFRYARRLVEGDGLVFNRGERVEGYTNFLWVLATGAALRLGLNPMRAAQLLSLVAQAVTLVATFHLARDERKGSAAPLIAAAFLACQSSFLIYPMTGLESSAFAACATLAVLACWRRVWESTGGACLLALLLLAVGLTRFDGFTFVGVLALTYLTVERPGRRFLLPLAVFTVGLAAYNLWRFSYYGSPFPNTFYAKVSFRPGALMKGAGYLYAFLVGTTPVTALLASLALLRDERSRKTFFLAGIVAGQFAYVAFVGGDWMPHGRFVLPVLPLLCVLMAQGLESLLPSGVQRERRAATALAALVCVVLLLHPFVRLASVRRGRIDFQGALAGPWFQPLEAREIGKALDRIVPAGTRIATEFGGIIPFYMRHDVIDTVGLTDHEIARGAFPARNWGKQVPPEYLASREPDVVLPCGRLFASAPGALRSTEPGDPRRADGRTRPQPDDVRAAGQASRRHRERRRDGPCRFGSYLELTEPRFGYRVCALPIGDGRYFPALFRSACPGPLANARP